VDDDSLGTHDPTVSARLLREVDRAFEVTGADTPGWPDPHPDRNPRNDEYSRVTDVGRYRILDARVEAWVTVLQAAGIARSVEVPAEPWVAGLRPPTDHLRVRRLEPVAAGGLRLVVATTLVDGRPFGLDVGTACAGEVPALLAVVPDCGCDACDSGSADLLTELDGWVLTVARGGVVRAGRGEDVATRTWDGWSLGNGADPVWLDETAPVPQWVDRWIGASWLS